MVKLRLKRFGKKHEPSYRVVAIKTRTKRNGEAIEELGFYSPMTKELKLSKERIEYWLSVGAQPTKTVKRLFVRDGILKADKQKSEFKKEAGQKSLDRKKKKEEKSAKKEDKKVEEKKVEVKEEKVEVKEEVVEEKAEVKAEEAKS